VYISQLIIKRQPYTKNVESHIVDGIGAGIAVMLLLIGGTGATTILFSTTYAQTAT
jgi:hypothetical protein